MSERSAPIGRHPAWLAPPGGVAPAPRRLRGLVGGEVVVDTQRALYVFEQPSYPQYYFPLDDVRPDLLEDEGRTQRGHFGTYRRHGVRAAGELREGAARLVVESSVPELVGTVRIDWSALDAWFEEDEQVFVHPRNPYVRVDALRSTREVIVALEGVVLARSSSPVLVFETGLPTRYYLDRTDVDLRQLVPSPTVTSCPYKGTTSGYWSVRIGGTLHDDLAWAYDFPARQLLPIAGMIAFYNEQVDLTVDGISLERPTTAFSRRARERQHP